MHRRHNPYTEEPGASCRGRARTRTLDCQVGVVAPRADRMTPGGPVCLSDLVGEGKLLWCYCCTCGHERDLYPTAAPPPIASMVLEDEFQSLGTVQLVPEVRKMTVACAWIGKRERAATKEKSSSAGSGCWKLLRDDVRVICWNCSAQAYACTDRSGRGGDSKLRAGDAVALMGI